MKGMGWGLAIAMLLGSSSVALAEDYKPEPGFQLSLEERGPCSVIECAPMTPRKRLLIEREIEVIKRVTRNADLRPKHRELYKLHELLTELLHADMLERRALRERVNAACSNP